MHRQYEKQLMHVSRVILTVVAAAVTAASTSSGATSVTTLALLRAITAHVAWLTTVVAVLKKIFSKYSIVDDKRDH